MPEHNEPLARYLFRSWALTGRTEGDWLAMAYEAHQAADAFEAESLRRLADSRFIESPAETPVSVVEPTPPSGIPPEPAAGVGLSSGKPEVSVPVPPPTARCTSVRPGKDKQCEELAGHARECYADGAGIWRKDQCYHRGPVDPLLGSVPECRLARGHEGLHVSAICPSRPWTEAGEVQEEKEPKAKRTCIVPNCGRPGKAGTNALGVKDSAGWWCAEHNALPVEERRGMAHREKQRAKEERKIQRINARNINRAFDAAGMP